MTKDAAIARRPMQMYGIEGLAASLDVSTKTVRRWIKARQLPAHRLGRQWRITEEDLEEFLAQRRKV